MGVDTTSTFVCVEDLGGENNRLVSEATELCQSHGWREEGFMVSI